MFVPWEKPCRKLPWHGTRPLMNWKSMQRHLKLIPFTTMQASSSGRR